MDRIREALGEAKLTYFGFSYGTFLGTVYAGLFPDHVRALVLDGAIDPNQALEQRLATQAKGFDDALDAFLAQCKTDATCAFHNDGHPAEAYDALMAKIDAGPLPATVMQDPRPVGPGEAFIGVLFALYARDSWPTLAQALDMAQGGDGSLLLAMSDAYNDRQPDGTYSNEAAANNAVNCTDYKVPTDPAAYEAMVPDLQKVAPRFGQAIAYSGDDLRVLAGAADARSGGHPCRRRAADPRGRDDKRPGDAVPVGAESRQGAGVWRAVDPAWRGAHRVRVQHLHPATCRSVPGVAEDPGSRARSAGPDRSCGALSGRGTSWRSGSASSGPGS